MSAYKWPAAGVASLHRDETPVPGTDDSPVLSFMILVEGGGGHGDPPHLHRA